MSALLERRDDAGPPEVPTGGKVAGEVTQLLAGKKARLQLGPRLVREDNALVITGIGLGVNRDLIARNLMTRADTARLSGTRPRSTFRPTGPAPLTSVWDESTDRVGTRIVCNLVPGVDPDVAEQWVRMTWPVTVEVGCRLPAPQRKRLTGWDRGDGTGLRRLADLLSL